MNSPELADTITANRQQILDSGIRIAASLVGGQDVIDQALEMQRTDQEVIGQLTEEEKKAYFGREDAFTDFMEFHRSAQKRIDMAMEKAGRDPTEIPNHTKIIEVAEKAPLVAVNLVDNVGGFVLGALEPPLHVAPHLPEPVVAPKGILLEDIGELVKGYEIDSQRARHIRIVLFPGLIYRFDQFNSFARGGMMQPSDEKSSGYVGDNVVETPLPQEVPPDLELLEVDEYLARYAKGLRYMEELPTAEILEEIEPRLELGWTPEA